jgi:hypothetical protein
VQTAADVQCARIERGKILQRTSKGRNGECYQQDMPRKRLHEGEGGRIVPENECCFVQFDVVGCCTVGSAKVFSSKSVLYDI